MSAEKKPITIFISYAHEDEDLKERLKRHLSLFERQGLISAWHDRDIQAGQEWAHAIDIHLNAAAIILLLVSADFIASEYCYSIEMKRAMERHGAKEARVIPIILHPTKWERALFGKLQALPCNGQPVTTWANPDKAFVDIATGIEKVLIELSFEQRIQIGDTFFERQDYKEALEAYEQAIGLDAQRALAYSKKCATLNELGRYDKALTACEQAICLDPNDAYAHIGRDNALNALKQHREALDAYEQTRPLIPTTSHVQPIQPCQQHQIPPSMIGRAR